MKLKKLYIFEILLLLVNTISWSAQEKDSLGCCQKEIIKKDWTFCGVPALAFDSDVGFRYGVIINLYNYGDGSKYPKYNDYISVNVSRTTKGSGTNEFIYDSYSLIKKLRTTFECSYLTEQTLDFYGFNGYEANYIREIEDENSSLYKSDLFYRMDRKLLRIRSDFQGRLSHDKLKWLAGLTFYNIKPDTVDINTLNKGQNAVDRHPFVNGGLYGMYKQSGLIPQNEINGGRHLLIKTGLIYDTRDNEANPMQGVWSDLQLIISPSFQGNRKGFIRFSATHRQYYTLIPKKLSLACRASIQNKIAGTIPFYLLPFVHYLTPYTDNDGLGGMKTLRGILRNRVVGDGIAYGNIEFRWKLLSTVVWKQNMYLCLSAFLDGGMVTQKYEPLNITDSTVLTDFITNDKEKPHMSAGVGFHFVLNENFIISADHGQSFDKRDGISGLYVGIGFLY